MHRRSMQVGRADGIAVPLQSWIGREDGRTSRAPTYTPGLPHSGVHDRTDPGLTEVGLAGDDARGGW